MAKRKENSARKLSVIQLDHCLPYLYVFNLLLSGRFVSSSYLTFFRNNCNCNFCLVLSLSVVLGHYEHYEQCEQYEQHEHHKMMA